MRNMARAPDQRMRCRPLTGGHMVMAPCLASTPLLRLLTAYCASTTRTFSGVRLATSAIEAADVP
jgi:hypothetical protein